ncbi:hypothetical protein sscle_08g067100 [Sclerotinia sclerotiorum 1980 UF-70]|uniref:Uncharacterized protein n=1 Tax=Sclerotinia sclerotiorum (strain ATCC 18683 / 1980 / Ss-1) TaxID=665079 RepID=A0A1D9QAG0_SCLS1|nr:hypothetical protein sscle_08g067100 [Sclerotinia sclerotiorum 1980 UF-70]
MDFQQAPPRGIIFDLRDVLFKWSAKTTTTISPRTLREIFKTPVWNSHELSSNHFSIPVTMIAEAFAQACKSLKSDRKIVSFLHELKKDSAIQAYAMSNVGKEDFEDLATKMDLLLFDRVFTSAAVGMRKPELGFYNHVLEQICLNGSQVVFVDDKEDNVNAARQLGIRGYVFGESTIHMLSEIFDSPVSKGSRYLFQNAKHCDSITMSGVTFADNFAKLLILDSLQDLILMDLSWGSKETWNFFAGKTVLIPGGLFPDDLDTTYLALTVLRPSSTKTISSLLDTMAEYVNDDGTFQASHPGASLHQNDNDGSLFAKQCTRRISTGIKNELIQLSAPTSSLAFIITIVGTNSSVPSSLYARCS